MKKSQASAAIYAIVATATVFFLCDLIPDNYKTGLRKMTSDFLSPIFEDQFSPRSRKAGELCIETRYPSSPRQHVMRATHIAQRTKMHSANEPRRTIPRAAG